MFQNRLTRDIPYNESAVAKVIYGNGVSEASSFVKPEEITQKSSTGKDYSEKRPGVNYKSFGKK